MRPCCIVPCRALACQDFINHTDRHLVNASHSWRRPTTPSPAPPAATSRGATPSSSPQAAASSASALPSFVLSSFSRLAAGQECLICYSDDYSNTDMSLLWGFTMPANQYETLDLNPGRPSKWRGLIRYSASLPQDLSLHGPSVEDIYETMIKELRDSGGSSSTTGGSSRSSDASLSSSHTSEGRVGDDEELQRLVSVLDSLPLRGTEDYAPCVPLSQGGELALERGAVTALLVLCHSMVAELPSSVQEDGEVLDGHRRAAAAVAVAGEHKGTGAGLGAGAGLDMAGGRQLLSPRHLVAVHARMAHKLLLGTAVRLLERYSSWLDEQQ